MVEGIFGEGCGEFILKRGLEGMYEGGPEGYVFMEGV